MRPEAWFVIATLLAPTGYVVQDVVADAMTVEAVPTIDEDGKPYPDGEIKVMHTTMQTLGRFSIIGGLVAVAALNITMFEGVEDMSEEMKVAIYADIYLLALVIPLLSISGVILGGILLQRRARALREHWATIIPAIDKLLFAPAGETHPNWWILGGSLVFAIFTMTMGVSQVPLAQEIIFIGSMSIILFLMYRLLLELEPEMRNMLIGTAIIIFVFRATPLPGPGASWFEIDELGFDQQFLSVLSLIASSADPGRHGGAAPDDGETFDRLCHRSPDHRLGILALPNIGLYYGLHEWTAAHTGGVVDARFIAVIDTTIESPLGQISMIPMLAWIAKNAPPHLKATFFAVMASFTNLALSAASLGTKYLNEIYTVTREVRDRVDDVVTDRGRLQRARLAIDHGLLIGLLAPLLTVFIVQRSRLHTQQ